MAKVRSSYSTGNNNLSYSNVDERDRTALSPWFAAKDAQEYTKKWKPTYPISKHSETDALKKAAQDVFIRSRIYENYREKFITVKVESVDFRDIVSPEYKKFLTKMTKEGYEVKTGRGKNLLVYIPR